MELSGVSILLLVFIPIADACIPTKTPEPGIPATTASPYKCPALKKLSVPDCTTTVMPFPKVCSEAIFTPASVSCVAGSRLLFKTSATGYGEALGPLTCKGTEWTLPNGMPLTAPRLTAPIACATG